MGPDSGESWIASPFQVTEAALQAEAALQK